MSRATTTKAAPKTLRCAVYTRKSTEEGLAQEFNSLDAQRESAEAYIASMKHEGWTCLPARYDDGGFTGGNMERPALRRLVADIEAGEVDCVVVYKVDRLSRSLMDFARMMELFERKGVSFVSVTQQFSTTNSMGRLTLNILLSFAQFEREIISERTRDKIAAARRKGKWAGGRPVLGYDILPGIRLVVNEPEAERVRAIFGLYLEHRSALRVARVLKERGWTTKRWTARNGKTMGGRPFDKHALLGLLGNVLYAGQVRHREHVHAGEHEAIVDRRTFDRVQELIRSNGATGGMHERNRHGALLKSLLLCAPCGRAMTHSFTTKGGRSYRYYVCCRAQKEGWDACPSRSVPAEAIEGFVVERIRALARDPALLAATLAQAQEQDEQLPSAAADRPTRADVEAGLAAFEPLWAALCPRERARIDRLFRGSGLMRDKWADREDYRGRTIRKAVESCSEFYRPAALAARARDRRSPSQEKSMNDADDLSPDGEGAGVYGASDRAVVVIDTDEYRAVGETIGALRADGGIFTRGTMLVRVLREQYPDDGVVRQPGSPVIAALPGANLRERITRCAALAKYDKHGELQPAHPPAWLVGAVLERGLWPGLRPLAGISDVPVLRPDGTVWQSPGYDRVTGVLYEPAPGMALAIPDEPTRDDAWAAVDTLLEIVEDFRFESDEHRAAWLAGLLTPLARFAFEGPAPLFLIDANIRGAGKGLLAQTVGRVALGRDMPVSSYAHDSDEMRKKITAIAIAADRVVLLDNLEGSFGHDTLDRALTCTRWKDRILGRSEQVDLPLQTVWYATGNNVQVGADTARRLVHIRLDVLEEKPEERSGFRHPDLLAWIASERPRLLGAALTILSAFIRAGRPSQGLTPMGSFEGWSSTVREAVVWAGLPDPCRSRAGLMARADTTRDTLAELIAAWERYVPDGEGLVVADALAALYPPERQRWPMDESSVAMRAALESLVGAGQAAGGTPGRGQAQDVPPPRRGGRVPREQPRRRRPS